VDDEQSPAEAFADVKTRLSELTEYAGYLLSAKVDGIKLAIRNAGIYAALGAVGLLAGALIAALLPATRFEDELVGTTRDELWEKAEDAGQDAISRVRDAATHAIDSATDAAATRVRATATQVVEAATEAATDTIKGELGGASKS